MDTSACDKFTRTAPAATLQDPLVTAGLMRRVSYSAPLRSQAHPLLHTPTPPREGARGRGRGRGEERGEGTGVIEKEKGKDASPITQR